MMNSLSYPVHPRPKMPPAAQQPALRFGTTPQAMAQARQTTAKRLKIPGAANGPVDLNTLRQAFMDAFYLSLAKFLVEGGDVLPVGNSFYQCLSDSNLTETDFCEDKALLHLAFKNHEDYASNDYQTVLGYSNPKQYNQESAPYRKATARKLGMPHKSPTDRQIIEKMGTMTEDELIKAFGLRKPKAKKAVTTQTWEERMNQYLASVPRHFFLGRNFVLTGTLKSMSRAEAKAIIERYGGKVLSAVTDAIHCLIVGQNPGAKLQAAKEKGIHVVSEDEFRTHADPILYNKDMG